MSMCTHKNPPPCWKMALKSLQRDSDICYGGVTLGTTWLTIFGICWSKLVRLLANNLFWIRSNSQQAHFHLVKFRTQAVFFKLPYTNTSLGKRFLYIISLLSSFEKVSFPFALSQGQMMWSLGPGSLSLEFEEEQEWIFLKKKKTYKERGKKKMKTSAKTGVFVW